MMIPLKMQILGNFGKVQGATLMIQQIFMVL